MRCRTLASTLVPLLLTAHAATQCQPAHTHIGDHKEFVGFAIASDGDEALFGHFAYYAVSTGLYARLPDDRWFRTAVMGGTGAGATDMGYAVALRHDVAVLGDPPDYTVGGFVSWQGAGAAVVWERNNGVWSRINELYPPTPTPNGGYGLHVAVAEDASRALVGAPRMGALGEVHVYERDATGWVLEQTIAGAGLSMPAQLGGQSAMIGGYLFVAASDAVVVFTQAGLWTEAGTLTPAPITPGSGFGETMSVDGTHIVIAAPRQARGSETGMLFDYDVSQTGWMTQPMPITPQAGSSVSLFGRALSLRDTRLAIGAKDRAFEYQRWPDGSWHQFIAVWPPPRSYGYSADFGEAVGLYTNGLLVGDSNFDDDAFNYPDGPGGVHAYDLTDHGKPLRACGRGLAIFWGGSLQIDLYWPQYAGESYYVLGSLTGTGPIPVAGLQIPITPDVYTQLLPATGFLPAFAGTLNAAGRANLSFDIPTGLPPAAVGLQFHHAAVIYDTVLRDVTNAVTSTLF